MKKTPDVIVSREKEAVVIPKKPRKLSFSRKYLGIPYALFLCMFVILPMCLIVYYAFTNNLTGKFTFANFGKFFSSASTLATLFTSLLLALLTTVCCLLIGYPVAYILARCNLKKSNVLLMLFITPMWINFVLRAMAMKEVLNLLGMLGNYNFLNTLIGMVYDYLPFMILPLYTVLIKMDKNVLEASEDLGANPLTTFLKITLPLSLPGIISGVTMVFMPTMTCYVISDTFGNSKITIIGKLIESQFGEANNWSYGSAIALILLVIMFLCMLISGEFGSKTKRGTNL